MRIVQRVLSRREKIESLVSNLESLAAQGGVTPEQYNELRAEYAALEVEADANVAAVREYLRAKEAPLREERRQLQTQLNQLDARQKVGELNEAQAERARHKLEVQLQAAERKLLRLESALNTQSSADVGGYVDVEVRARIEPGKLRDELDAPELMGAAQESLREWQGRAQDFYETARDRGQGFLEREDVTRAATKVRSVGERVKAWTDEKAELGAEMINRRLESRGREGVSPSSLKIVVVLILMLILLFMLLRWDSYPKSPAAVLESMWTTANAEEIEDIEQFLSLTTVTWMRQALPALPGKDFKNLLQEKWARNTHQHTVTHLEILSEQISTRRATVRYRVHYRDGQTSPAYTQTLVWEDGRWKIESRMTEVF